MKTKQILLTGLIAGTLDGLAAIITHLIRGGNNPAMIFKFIASGVFGSDAFAGGDEIVATGVLFHYIIATGWTALFFITYPKIQWKHKYASGFIYGIFVWIMMNLVIVPLSSTPPIQQGMIQMLVGIGIIIIAIGLPISMAFHRFHKI